MVRTGSMKEEIIIQSRAAVADGQGGVIPTWSTIATEWAKVTEVSYERALIDQGVKFTKVCQFDMRERGDTYTMGAQYRIYWGTEYFIVFSVVTNNSKTVMLAYDAV